MAMVALAGMPNVGKSTLFNALTGGRQRVGNWPGTTVRLATGDWHTSVGTVGLIDLPGTASLVPRSPGERVVLDILDDVAAASPRVVVAVVDAANLARSLYLLAQLLELPVRVVVALGMCDVAAARGLRVDVAVLATSLGVPVVPVSGRFRDGLGALAAAVSDALGRAAASPSVGARVDRPAVKNEREYDDAEIAVAERRCAWVHQAVTAAVHRPDRPRPLASDRIDRVLVSRWLGVPILLLVMWAVFVAIAKVATPCQRVLAAVMDGPVTGTVRAVLGMLGLSDTWVAGLMLDGLVGGVGQVLTFIPLMLVMFVLLAILEESGYTARAAFVTDRLLRTLGLPGHAFLPLIIGFGCNVPAVSGTRILANAQHRLMTCLLVPFVTCSARLVVYVLLAGAFFGDRAGSVVFAMYLLSIVLVVVAGIALRHTVLRHQPRESLVLDLPPYRMPAARVVVAQSWQKLAGFLRATGGIIVATVATVWLLAAVPVGGGRFNAVEPPDSLYGLVSRAIAPVFAPAGFDDWHISGALLTGLVAKEAVVSTLAQTHRADQPSDPRQTGELGTRLRATLDRASSSHPIPAVLALLLFVLSYTPCIATVAAQRAEIGAKWTAFGVGSQFVIAWLLATLVFQIGRLIV